MMHNYRAPFLKEGDCIDIIAPSSGVPQEELHNTLLQIKKLFAAMRLNIRIKDNFINYDHYFSANSDDFRKQHLINALINNESKAVWCIRGGYGLTNIITHLLSIQKLKKPKLVAGFSDITALHIFLHQQWQWPSLHCKVLYQLVDKENTSEDELDNLKRLIMGKINRYIYDIIPLNIYAKNLSSLEGKVVGGNMSIIQSSIGTEWEINCKNKFLLLEEINERGYKIDRMLYHYEQAGILEKAKALLLGDIICNNESEDFYNYAIQRFLDRSKIPVFRIRNIGHGKQNKPIFLGVNSEIIKEKNEYKLVTKLSDKT